MNRNLTYVERGRARRTLPVAAACAGKAGCTTLVAPRYGKTVCAYCEPRGRSGVPARKEER